MAESPNELVSMLDVLQNTFTSMRTDPTIRRSGRTTKMLQEVVDYIVSEEVQERIKKGRVLEVLVIIPSLHIHEYFISSIIALIQDTRTLSYFIHKTYIRINSCIFIRFITADNLYRYAGVHPSPKRFVDHHVEEKAIEKGLDSIANKIEFLRTGL